MHEQDGDSEPAHHARRPMNAFLIFCKRHRSVVRDKYPNLENRSITKILGEWWANLDKEEKAGYTGLAKQYKDAFFSANPDFKWYKLPAPPLRTLSARPRDSDKHEPDHDHDRDTDHDERTNNNSTRVDLNARADHAPAPRPLAMFTPGKLADEAQMGGLSSLLAKTDGAEPPYSPSRPARPEYGAALDRPRDTIRELQNALSETSKLFEEELDEAGAGAPARLTHQDVIDQIVEKRYSTEDGSDDERGKSGRSCKGKRYQQFMAGGLLKRPRPDASPDADEPGNSRAADDDDARDQVDAPDDGPASKTFKAADFDLDAKIRALPSLSLEKFQQRKRENKRKKKSSSLKPRAPGPAPIINAVPRSVADERRDAAEARRDAVTGSQKRKPRKRSITRLEINSLIARVEVTGNKVSPEIRIAAEAPCVRAGGVCGAGGASAPDLLALATLAEVAAHTSKLESALANDRAAEV